MITCINILWGFVFQEVFTVTNKQSIQRRRWSLYMYSDQCCRDNREICEN